MPKKTYRYNPESKELELVYDSDQASGLATGSEADHHHFVRGDIPDFVSPIDGTRIGSRSQLRDHTKRYGVVPQAELCPRETARKAEERRQMTAGIHPSQKAARIEALRASFERTRDAQRSRGRYG